MFPVLHLANLVNEAALLAARKDKETVGAAEFDAAIDRVVGGLEKKNRVMNPQEKEIVQGDELRQMLSKSDDQGLRV